jgi:uncharacterized membrane protein HdeD (DUF308 family)
VSYVTPPLAGSPLDHMSAALARNWWAVALRGVFAIVFGLVAFLLPVVTVETLVLLFAAYMLADGVFAIIAAARAAAHHERWGWMILEGVVDIAAGVVALLMPAITVLVFVTLLGVWALISGAMMIFYAFRLHATHGRWLLLLSGLVSLLWGAMLFVAPVTGALVLTWWIGAYALVFGVMLVILAFRLRSRHGLRPTTFVVNR